ncbi:hypothetical protein [Methylosinus sp. KRF6]|uniref:hypothetical protein n=1 Tax=Methylosinus sp. KRF6 TaxID=2846853 RepID=UPI001C0B8A1D|nr:hypothetical protein [Methylosinus sp. KRF6]MBU3888018.1 hypothetical protein [Methylosinus sp. KRF6]
MTDVATHLHFVDGEDAQGLALGLPEPDNDTTQIKPASEQDLGSDKKTLAATIATSFARIRTEFLGPRRKPIDAATKEEPPFSETGADAGADSNAPRIADPDEAPRGAAKEPRTNLFDPFDRYKLVTSVSLAAVAAATIAAVALWPNGGGVEVGVTEKGADVGLMAPASKLASVPPNERAEPVLEIPAESPPQKIKEEVRAFWTPEDARKAPAGPLTVATPASAPPSVVSEVGVRPPPPAAPEAPKALPAPPLKTPAAPPPALPPSVAAPVATAAPATASEAPAKAREEGIKRFTSLPPEAPVKAEEKQLEMETRLFGMITELSTLVRRTREEIATLQDSDKRMARAIEAKLNDFERRLNLGEAQRSLDAAKATPTSPPEPASPPPAAPAARPATGMKGVVPASLSTQSGADATMPPARYRVQAASPGLAMLAELDRSGDEIAPLQIGIGAHVPGYGRVTKISQRGTEWVVQTEKGPIR